MENQYSAFSNTILLGTSNPTGNPESGPAIGEFGVPGPPSSIEAPQDLVSEYMTLSGRCQYRQCE